MSTRKQTVVLAGAALLIAFGTRSAQGQLTPQDIEQLRRQGEREGWTFTVGENAATRRPLDELCGLIEEENWPSTELPQLRDEPLALPAAFDWRPIGGCTPIRDQDGCGSCWAFSAVGAVECWLSITERISVDLSEQWLISCTAAGSCAGGWHTSALDYMRCDGEQDYCGRSGAVLESAFPYQAVNAPCGCPYAHPYCAPDWRPVAAVANPANIKRAIWEHGPVSAAVYVSPAFSAYTGGVFNACSDGPLNHAIVLVGWDDSLGDEGAWILRNSWGEDWGMDGYMYIAYGCCRVGQETVYLDYPATDCNSNGIRDICELDCGALDNECNVPGCGTGIDCNGNGAPDQCDLAGNDCNANGVPDDCDVDLVIAAAPQNVEVCPGATAVLTVSAVNPASATFDWMKDGVPLVDDTHISGVETPVLTITGADSQRDDGAYTCRVADGCLAFDSAPAMLTVLDPPLITQQPPSRKYACRGEGVAIGIAAEGSLIKYQWRRNDVPLAEGGKYVHVSTPTLWVNDVNETDELDLLTCRVFHACSETISQPVQLRVADPIFTTLPVDDCASIGDDVVMTAQASSPMTVWYQWRKDGTAIATGDTLNLTNVQPDDEGAYHVIAYTLSPTCPSESPAVTLTVGDCPQCALPGDMDGDGDRDLRDLHFFLTCYGTNVLGRTDCACANVDGDDWTVGPPDWNALEEVINGPGQ